RRSSSDGVQTLRATAFVVAPAAPFVATRAQPYRLRAGRTCRPAGSRSRSTRRWIHPIHALDRKCAWVTRISDSGRQGRSLLLPASPRSYRTVTQGNAHERDPKNHPAPQERARPHRLDQVDAVLL